MNRTLGLILGILALAACGGYEFPTPDPVGTQVSVEKAVAATLTAEVPTPSPTPTHAPTRTATPKPEMGGSPTPLAGPSPAPACTGVGQSWTRPGDGMEMVCVPAGEFLMGSGGSGPEARDDEKPRHAVYLDAFWIDRTEVTNAQYLKCVQAGACQEPGTWEDGDLNAPDQPVVCVRWEDARAYATWAGGRLPTEAEWEKAARGTDGRLYPWGNSPPDCSRANYAGCAGHPLAVGSHPDGASPYGALDMAGNVWEWVADLYDGAYYSRSPASNPQGPGSGIGRVLRGGSFDYAEGRVRCAGRHWANPEHRIRRTGFRVVMVPAASGP